MSGGLSGLLVFAVLPAAALLSLWLYPHLPQHYRLCRDDKQSAARHGRDRHGHRGGARPVDHFGQGGFDLARGDVQALAADLIVLDRTLRLYGPDAAHACNLPARYTERVLGPSSGEAPAIDDPLAEDLLNQTEQAILSLQPDPQEPDFKEQALTQVRSIVRRRQMLIQESGSAVSPPIVVALTRLLWLIFASFGYNPLRNA